MECRKTHEIILLNQVRVRCLCGWAYKITEETKIDGPLKDILLDAYNDHKRL